MRIRHLFFALLLVGLHTLPGAAWAEDILVIVNPRCAVTTLTPSQVSDLYMGRVRSLPNGSPAFVIESGRHSSLREQFFKQINGMSIKQVNAYWARLQFSGQVLPPPSLDGDKEVITMVRNNVCAIGYIDASQADDSVRVVLTLKND